MKILNIAHLSHNGDGGDAAAIRTNFIMKGLLEKGCEIKTISYAHDEKTLKNYNCNSTDFDYLSHTYIKNKFMRNLFKLLIQPFLLFIYICKCKKHIDVIFFDRVPIYFTLPLVLSKILFKVKIVWGVNEFPADFVGVNVNRIKAKMEHVSFHILGRLSNSIIVISSDHKLCYEKYTTTKTKILVIPILMDTKDICEVENINPEEKIIAYGGALSTSNGIDFLLEVVKDLLLTMSNFKLSIFGPSISPEYLNCLRKKIDEFGLKNNVLLTGAMPNDKAIEYMKTCDILVIPKIKDKRSIGYIPSKLGDFLFSGKPVVVTNVGDVSKYINDGLNGYLVEPDDTRSFSECLRRLIINYDEAFAVGKEGQRTACLFDYRIQSQKIYALISEL